jgi:hypothetical protein
MGLRTSHSLTTTEDIMKKSRLASCLLGAAGFLTLLGCTQSTLAARLVDVSIVNRSTGERLTPWRHGGKLYVAGTPGEPYAVELKGKRGERVLAVLAVDGINVLTGETAATLQSGYVIEGWQSYAINGWRKSMDDVARFVFTALPDSYAARTGRPADVGVIGVAVYRERTVPPQAVAPTPLSPAPAQGWRDSRESASAGSGALAERRADQARSRPESEAKSMKLGTGHGPREHSPTRYTEFERNSDTPDEIITIYYDSRANLVARGIIPPPRLAEPQPFPAGGGFVPDPRG